MLEFRFPDIGEGIAEGRLLKWMVKPGDVIMEGDPLFLVETDKVNAEIPSPAGGTVVEVMAKEGDIINVGDVIVKIGNEKDSLAKEPEAAPDAVEEENAGVVGSIEVSSEVIQSSNESADYEAEEDGRALATPVARALAKDLDIDINTVNGTGPAGRVMKEDIYRAKEQQERAADLHEGVPKRSEVSVPPLKVSGEVERVALTTLGKTVAKNMVLSKSIIPHAAVMDEFDMTELVRFRSENKVIAEGSGVKLTYMPFIIKAVTQVLKEFPVFNSSYDGEVQEIILKKYYNVGIAVDTPDGLLVPVIKDADRKGILQIAKEMKELAEDARNKGLTLDKLQNGTFTITNYGAVGVASGVPVIRYPESAIFGAGKIIKKPVVSEEGEIVVRDIMPVALCFDHRIIDGGTAGRFTTRLRQYLQNPNLLLLS